MNIPDTKSDAFDQGVVAFADLHNSILLFPAVPLNPYDPSVSETDYEEWESGYEYSGYLSIRPERDTTQAPSTKKMERLFGPFRPLLNNKENPSP